MSPPMPAQARERADAAVKAVAELHASVQEAAKNSPPEFRRPNSTPCKSASPRSNKPPKRRAPTSPRRHSADIAARLALSAAALRDAVASGAPFAAELAQAKSLGADDKMLAPLAPFAATGVPARAGAGAGTARAVAGHAQDFRRTGAGRRLPRTAGGQCRQTGAHPPGQRAARRRSRPPCWRASKSTPPKPTSPPRSPISASSPTQRARRRRPGLQRRRRARPRSRPRVNTPPIRRARSGQGEGAMIRVILFLLAVAVLAAGFVWVADRPGDVVITWMGYHIETSVMVAALALAALVLVLMAAVGHRARHLALARAGVAVLPASPRDERLSGDLARIDRDRRRRFARRAQIRRRRGAAVAGDPLALLLAAQSAQMAGDRGGAERAFREMTRRDDTKLLGLRGLYIEAQRRDDADAARLAAEEAVQGVAGAGLGRTGGARLSLCRRRLGRRARRARCHEGRAGEARLSPQARRAADRPRAGAGRDRPRRLARGGAGSGQARARSGAGGGVGRPAAGGSGRAAQGAQDSGEGVDDQPASRHRRGLCEFAARRQRARTPRAHAEARRHGAGPTRRRAGGGARRARCARICRRAGGTGAVSLGADTARRHR